MSPLGLPESRSRTSSCTCSRYSACSTFMLPSSSSCRCSSRRARVPDHPDHRSEEPVRQDKLSLVHALELLDDVSPEAPLQIRGTASLGAIRSGVWGELLLRELRATDPLFESDLHRSPPF